MSEKQDGKDIIQWVASGYHVLGLRMDGTVMAKGRNDYGQCDVKKWRDIVQVAAGNFHSLGLRKDGTVVATGWDYSVSYTHLTLPTILLV